MAGFVYKVKATATNYIVGPNSNPGAYLNGFNGNPGTPLTNMSQIDFVDNGLVTFLQGSPTHYETSSPSEFYNELKSVFGDSVNAIYSAVRILPNALAVGDMESAIPSLFLLFQTVRDQFMSLTSYPFTSVAMYYPSLQRVTVGGPDGVAVIYKVNSDNSLTVLGLTGSIFVGYKPQRMEYRGHIPVFNSAVEFNSDNAKNPANWFDMEMRGYDSVDRTLEVNVSTGGQLTSLLFGDFVKPDGNLPTNPYEPANPSGPGDLPPGTFDDTSDPIPWPSLPTISAADTGFTRIYNPTLSQVQDLARYLWTDNNLIGTLWNKIKQFFEDPMQSFIAFNLVPCPVPDGGVEEFQLLFIPTGVNLTTAANQFVDVDCGTCEIPRYYGSALDQTPYTKISCFLPYIGMVALDTDEVIGTTLQVKYRIDIVSGSCVAGILVDGNLLYQYSGHCAITIPLASADFSRYIQAAIAVAGTALGALVPGAGSALSGLMGLAEDAEQQTDYVVTKYYDRTETVRNPETGRQITASGVHTTTRTVYPAEQTNTKASFAGLTPSNISNTVGEVMSAKAAIQHSGSFSGNSGYLGLRRPYLLITRPRMCLPENYQSLNGYPSMITMPLGDCVGYTRVQQVQLTGMHATNPEQAEILELLKTGVVF